MSAITFFKPCGTGNYEWLQLGSVGDESRDYSVGDAERLAAEAGATELVLIAPAEQVVLREVDFDPSEKKLLRQTLPYSLEEELAEDVEDLHFALGSPAESSVNVAVVKRDLMEQWCDSLAEEQLEAQEIVSELQLLPLIENGWTLLVRNEQWLVRIDGRRGFALEAETAGLALQLLLDETEQLPEQLLVCCDEERQPAIQSQLPEMLRGIVQWRNEPYWSLIADGWQQQQTRINLFQGDFALSLPWKKWWKSWRVVGYALLAAVVLNLVLAVAQVKILEARNLALRAETEQAYRSAIPRGAVMDPAQQLRRKVSALRSSGGEGFVSLLDRVAQVLTSVKGLELQSINYTEKQSELRLTIVAPEFNDVETVRSKLEKAGLTAELTGSNAEGSKTRARLRVRG